MPLLLADPPTARHRRTARTAPERSDHAAAASSEADTWAAIGRTANRARAALSATDAAGLPKLQTAGAAAYELATGRFLLDRLLERYVGTARSASHRAWRRFRSRHCKVRRQFTQALGYAQALGGGESATRPQRVPSLFDPLGRPPTADRFLRGRTGGALR